MATMTLDERLDFDAKVKQMGYRKAGPWAWRNPAAKVHVRAVFRDPINMTMDVPKTLDLMAERIGVDDVKPESKNKSRRSRPTARRSK